MRFLFAAGGTAGHIYPAIAIANQLKDWLPDAEILFVGAKGKMELELVPKEGYQICAIPISNFQRKLNPKGIMHNLGSVKNLALSSVAVKKILDEFSPQVVIGTGGYVCYPVLKEAAKGKIPTVLHESNAIPGLTTKRLAPMVDRLLLGVKGTESVYPKAKNVRFIGIPVREAFLSGDQEEARKKLGIKGDKSLVLSFWGSLGALHMNNAMPRFFERLSKQQDFYHIHATGGSEERADTLKNTLLASGINAPEKVGIDIRPFIHDMPNVMAAADLVLCRAGASTLAELTALGKPSILVPSPYVTANHQVENAKVFVKSGAAIMLEEKHCDGDVLFEQVSALVQKPKALSDMAAAMKSLSNPDATREIAEMILSMAQIA